MNARKKELSSIQRTLEGRGFEVVSLQQHWRHVYGEVFEGEARYFFKMASSTGVGLSTRNELKWAAQVQPILTKAKSPISIPSIYRSGTIAGSFFFLAEFVEGNEICLQHRKPSTTKTMKAVHQIAELLLILLAARTKGFREDSAYNRVKYPGEKFARRAEKSYKSINRTDLLPVLKIAKTMETHYHPSLAHGDFTPWHLRESKRGELFLIDGELASSTHPRYYDLAYCYHRLVTHSGRPGAAEAILNAFVQRLPKRHKKGFADQFHAVLAERIIGGFWDVLVGSRAKREVLFRHEKLKNRFLRREIL